MVEHAVVMAGGSGTRLWPASRAAKPKQFLAFGRERSLFQHTLERVRSLGLQGHVIVVTHRDHRPEIVRQWEQMGGPFAMVVLEEPVARNTAPAVTYAAQFLRQAGAADSRMIVLPSDHLIEPPEAFRADVERADTMARDGRLVTFGIPPREPATGYGYIETGDARSTGYRVASFHEKPDRETAVSYIERGNFYWNAGIFVFPVELFLDSIQTHAPDVAGPFRGLKLKGRSRKGITLCRDPKSVAAAYERLPAISVDYALMERTEKAGMVPASFQWSDVGSWDEVCRLLSEGRGDVIEADAAENYVYADIPVALAGVRDLIVVVKDGAVLVCRKGRSQSVRDVVQKLKDAKRGDLL